MTTKTERRVILHDVNCKWERDYVADRLVGHLGCEILYLLTEELLSYQDTSVQVLIVVFTSNLTTMARLRPLLCRVKPKAVLHLSDEWGTKPEFLELAHLTGVVLRQHWYPDKYMHYDNIFQIPLGYMTGFPREVSNLCLPISERIYVWAFIGTVNAPRRKMLDFWQSVWPSASSFVRTGGVKVPDMANIYGQSVFVPNERGAKRLDCFRLYEAMIMGAIPVVVGEEREMRETFAFEGDAPPWIEAQTWPEALQICQEMHSKPKTLVQKQHALLEWFSSHCLLARERLQKAIVLFGDR